MDAKKIGLFFLGLVLIMAIITLFLIDAANADPPVYDRASCDCIYAEVGDMGIYNQEIYGDGRSISGGWNQEMCGFGAD